MKKRWEEERWLLLFLAILWSGCVAAAVLTFRLSQENNWAVFLWYLAAMASIFLTLCVLGVVCRIVEGPKGGGKDDLCGPFG